MSRPLEFDKAQAVEAAMILFWQQGYGATSLHDLLDAMAISRSSFYAAFGDKRSLYLEVIALFALRTNRMLDTVRQREDPHAAIQQFFEQTLFAVPQRRMRRGCLLVNTVLELAAVDEGLNRVAADRLEDMRLAFEACFKNALDTGSWSSEQSPAQLARFVMTINQGLRVACRGNASRVELNDVLATMHSLLPVPAR